MATTRQTARARRRIERRQAVVMLLIMVFAVLVSFVLGIWVGRSSVDQQLVQQQSPNTMASRQVAAVPPQQAAKEQQAGGQQQAAANQEQAAGDTATTEGSQADQYSFYKTLPEGEEETSLGSGLNPQLDNALQQAQTQQKQVAADMAQSPDSASGAQPENVSAAKQGPAKEAVAVTDNAAAAAEQTDQSLKIASASGNHVVQIGSFKQRQDAANLLQRVQQEDWPGMLQKADLQDRGTWYRVLLGPYKSKAQAQRAARMVGEAFSLDTLVKRR